jgi:two-component system OmpR family sensor kinase
VIGAGVVVLGVLVAAGFWIGRLGLRPIAEVTDVADAISAGERSRRVGGTSGRTEAAHLARAMNVMLDEQQALEARLRQFVADASHELRTPVSVILGIADLWRQGQLESGSAGQDAMRRIGQAGRQMGGLVEDLLLLARLDDGGKLDDSPVDLVPLANEVVHDVGATDPLRNIVVQGGAAVVVAGDARALRQAISNLVTNSLRHTPPDSSVSIDVRATGSFGSVIVRDEGPGMTPEEADKAFDRFWRADSSRTRSGTGLGLSIVSGIVAGHQGDVKLQSDPCAGTTVTVLLPLSPDPPASMQ